MHTTDSQRDTDQLRQGRWFNSSCTQVRQGNWEAAAHSLARLRAALQRHLRAEETQLLAVLAQQLGREHASTALLRVGHQQVLGVLARMDASLAEADRAAFMKHAGTLRLVLQFHNQKRAALRPAARAGAAYRPSPSVCSSPGNASR